MGARIKTKPLGYRLAGGEVVGGGDLKSAGSRTKNTPKQFRCMMDNQSLVEHRGNVSSSLFLRTESFTRSTLMPLNVTCVPYCLMCYCARLRGSTGEHGGHRPRSFVCSDASRIGRSERSRCVYFLAVTGSATIGLFMPRIQAAFDVIDERPERVRAYSALLRAPPEPGYRWIRTGKSISLQRGRRCFTCVSVLLKKPRYRSRSQNLHARPISLCG